jgi:hypothetical protein
MGFAEVKQALLRDFARCVQEAIVPPLSGYLQDYLQPGCTVAPDDFRLLPLVPSARRFANTTSDCPTDCLLDLQSKYQQFIPDDWGGRLEKGSREIGTLGFNILEGVVLDIQEIEKTTSHVAWAEPILSCLRWERLLIRAVVDFGRYCQAKQVRLPPASCCPAGSVEPPAVLQQRYDASAEACGFRYDGQRGWYVLDLTAG